MRIILYIFLTLVSLSCFAEREGIDYESFKEENHNYHIITIDSAKYEFKLVKAHNGVFGRETLDMISKRKNAIAGINAGFFEIGGSEDGRPSGALIIDGQIIALSKGQRSFALLHNNKFYLEHGILDVKVSIGDKIYNPNQTNILSNDKDVILYSHLFGKTTLAPYSRKEVLINSKGEVEDIIEHGDNIIPTNGYILSFPIEYDISHIRKGQKAELNLALDPKPSSINTEDFLKNVVMGIPLILKNGKITENVHILKQSGYSSPHARTALGIKENGDIIMLVVEHEAASKIKNMTIDQARRILRKAGYKRADLEKMEANKLLGILQLNISSKTSNVGLTLEELALYMAKLGCKDAINLDGGGSSSMFFDGKIVNKTIGDGYEAAGEGALRSISDAIIVVAK